MITILLFTVLERIKMTDYNTFLCRVGEDKHDWLHYLGLPFWRG